MIQTHQIHALKKAADLPAIARSYAKLRRVGDHYLAKCCFHQEKTASLTIWRDRFICFGCGASGDAISFLIKVEGWSFQQAAQYLADRAGIQLDERKISRSGIATAAENARFCEWWWKQRGRQVEEQKAKADADVEAEGIGPGWDWLECVARMECRIAQMTPREKWALFCSAATAPERAAWKGYEKEQEAIFGKIAANTATAADLYRLVLDGRDE